MAEKNSSSVSWSAVERLSRSAVGRVTGRFSRVLGGSATLQATGRFLRRQLWAGPMIAAVLLAAAGWWVDRAVSNAMRQQRHDQLTTILQADVTALHEWMDSQRAAAEAVAESDKLLPFVQELLALEKEGDRGQGLVQSKAQAGLRANLEKKLARNRHVGFFLVAPSGIVLAADQDPPIGKALTGYRGEFFAKVVKGETAVSKPFRSPLLLEDEKGELRANLPTMFAAAPIRDESGTSLAALGLRIRPDDEFTKILQVARFGKTGETYAFDRDGTFLSQSRFDDQLKQMGLLADLPESQSVLTLQMRNPQVNMAEGRRPTLRRADQPLTRVAAAAAQGMDGCDPDGYLDYRGVPTAGAWQWLERYGFGVVTEVDLAEAMQPEHVMRRAFWLLMGMLILASVGILAATWFMARQQKELQKATLAARRLGQYALEEKLGSGGMGTVYKARHAMLRRPTAVKLLDVDKVSDAAIGRFEREVQLTAALTHPNTVAIFDYGRTPEGIFYYAMEYLEGMNLEELVAKHGPLPEARVVHVLKQVCGSLAEAHAQGLVHRDVKPANVFLTRRGGAHDFVKVLDFGLVKSLEGSESAGLTAANAVTGTPLYLSPEAVDEPDRVDARSDVYAIGAVGYFLLTGSAVFTGATVMEICMKHARATPDPPSTRLGRPVSPELEGLLLRCLAKSRDQRPADAAALMVELEAVTTAGRWTTSEAATWWANRDKAPTGQPISDGAASEPNVTSAFVGDTTMAYGNEGNPNT